MTTTTTFGRRLDLEGCSNFRDLGGYETPQGGRVRWRRVFRSDSLHYLTDGDVATLRDVIGLRSGFDLRTVAEIETFGTGAVYDGDVFYTHVPFVAQVGGDNKDLKGDLTALYFRMLDSAGDCVRRVFHAFASPAAFPAVYYCAAGKDRTGMLTAVLLKSLGVPDQDIVADYLLTEGLTLERLQERLRDQGKDLPLALIRPQPETIERFLCQFDRRFGSVEGYLKECGVGSQTLWSVRANLLEW